MTFARPKSTEPSGVIVPFFGPQEDVPEGWVVCDGFNGTPNLRDKYVKSTDSPSELPGGTGGQNYITLSTAQLPTHSHTASTPNGGAHTHSVTVGHFDLGHGGDDVSRVRDDDNQDGNNTIHSTTNGSHTHSSSLDTTGSANSIDNQPLTIETLFIKKL